MGGFNDSMGSTAEEYDEEHDHDHEYEVSELDLEKIEAIELLLYDDAQRAEALKQSNCVMREFMMDGKRDAVRQMLEKIPEGSDELIEKQYALVDGNDLLVMPIEQENIMREFDSISSWCEAVEAYEDWDVWYATRRPTPPDATGPSSGRGEPVRNHEQRDYNDKLGRWQGMLDTKFKEAKASLLAVLKFEDGWLMDAEDADADGDGEEGSAGKDLTDPEKRRRKELCLLLRYRYIPEICEFYHRVLHEHGMFKECIEIADIIACPFEGTHLHTVYAHADNIPHLQELLRRIGGSARCIIEKNPNADTLGY